MSEGGHDYSECASSWNDPYPQPDSNKQNELLHISNELAQNYGLPQPEHLELVKYLDWLSYQPSDVKIEGNVVLVPEDRPNFKAARKKLHTPLANALRKAEEKLEAVLDNETFAETLRQADIDGRLSDSISTLTYLRECADRAERMSGKSGGKGNPDWVSRFIIRCQKFWFEHKEEKTGISFVEHYDDTPIADWVHGLFVNIEALNGRGATRVSLLNTAVKAAKAYRP